MRHRLALILLAPLLLSSCTDRITPPGPSGGPAASVGDADHGTERPNPYARWLDPIVQDVQTQNFGTFDGSVGSLELRVVCFETNDPAAVSGGVCSADPAHWQDPANAVHTYRVSDGSVLIQDEQYHAQIELGDLSVSDGTIYTVYRLVATVTPGAGFGPVVVAFVDFRALANGKAKSSLSPDEIGLTGSKLPAKLRLDRGVVAHAIEDAILDAGAVVPDALRDFATGDFTVAVLQPNEPTTVVLEEEESGVTQVTAVFQFDGDELSSAEPTLFVVGEPVVAGEDVCGDAFPFEKSGCIRALAWSLGSVPPSGVTSGYVFSNEVAFCIATGIPQERQNLPWELIKIDDYGQGPEFQVLPRIAGGPCDLVDGPSAASAQLLRQPLAWLRQNVGRPVLDFIATPLYADHSVDKMGSTLMDLSDITAALLTDISFLDVPTGQEQAWTGQPVTIKATYIGTPDPNDTHAPGDGAAGASVELSVSAGALVDANDVPVTGPLTTGADGTLTVYWTFPQGASTLTATSPLAQNSPIMTTVAATCPVWGTVTNDTITPQPPANAVGRASTSQVQCSTQVEFVNLTRETVDVYWISFTGDRVLYRSLAPQESYRQQTWPEHPWIVVGRVSGDLAFFEPLPAHQAPAAAIVVDPFPDPVLAFDGAVAGQPGYTNYELTVTNWAAYDDAYFEARPDLPPCGLNASASRTWVDIHSADTGARIYGFCGLGTASALQNIWFGLADTASPPSAVYITLTDRLINRVVRSNDIPLSP